MSFKRYMLDRLGELSGNVFKMKNGTALPAALVTRELDKLNNPLVVPAEYLPDSARADRGGDGRAVHLRVADRRRVPANPGEGKICEDCVNFRYAEGQELIKHDSALMDQLRTLKHRAPRAEDIGLCTADDGRAVTSRFWGSIAEVTPVQRDGEWVDVPKRDEHGRVVFRSECPTYRPASEVTSSIDPRRGRALNPLGVG